MPERTRALDGLEGHARGDDEPLAVDPASLRVLTLARRVAASDVTVMLTGESGAGKEVYAHFIHRGSRRRSGPFVAVNCAAIPEAMLEAVLFGHERGAYTGASEARPGKFEQAHGGSLLLDEITEMPLPLQAKLLRAVQEREVERLGGAGPRKVDVRVVATSNRDLKRAVADGVLREDLYYRLNVFPLHVPALRDRRADVLPLARLLLARHAGEACAPEIGEAAAAALVAHDWPGNVRELENVVQRALVLMEGQRIEIEDVVLESAASGANGIDAARRGALDVELKQREDQLILDALRAEDGRRRETAVRLGISPRTLRYKLARLRAAGQSVP
jgi:two-component system response regulator FlrC